MRDLFQTDFARQSHDKKHESEFSTQDLGNLFSTDVFNAGAGQLTNAFRDSQMTVPSDESHTTGRDKFHSSVVQLIHSLKTEVTELKNNSSDYISSNSSKNKSSGNITINEIEMLKESTTCDMYPNDCYSLIALNGPAKNNWPKSKIICFIFGLFVFIFQASFLTLMIWSRVDLSTGDIESDNPTKTIFEFVPANSKVLIRISQVMCIVAYVIFPGASLLDLFKAFRYFPRHSTDKNDPVGFMRLSCVLRGIQGYLAVFAVFLVVITTETVVDIVLNFTALNMISNFDDEAFSLARSGMFGMDLRRGAKRIEAERLPAWSKCKSKVRLYWNVVGSTGAILFALLFVVIFFQTSSKVWTTQKFRLGFRDEIQLRDYSGCYQINNDRSMLSPQTRNTYNAYDRGNESLSSVSQFGYCEKDEHWVLFDYNEANSEPCKVKEIAHSSKTGDFDIATSFEEPWFTPDDPFKPLDLYLISESKEDNLHCDMKWGDGTCDEALNVAKYQYDNGDCCAATCTQSDCGKKGFTDAFDHSNIDGIGFPSCKDTRMHPISIYLNNFTSSRENAEYQYCVIDSTDGEEEWRKKKPSDPAFVLECNGAYVLSIVLEVSMENHVETVMVEDGASCKVRVRNTTSYVLQGSETEAVFDRYFFCSDPIWFINYTIYHGNSNDDVEILAHGSGENEYADFDRVPECYFTRLKNKVDPSTLYTTSSPVNKAVDWLVRDDASHSECENEFFIERFALAVLTFALDRNQTLINNQLHCYWQGIKCNALRKVTEINLPKESLQGVIPSELELLTDLKHLFVCKWNRESQRFERKHLQRSLCFRSN
jgi:hypothetical protein